MNEIQTYTAFAPLQEILDLIHRDHRFHIAINDLSGVLKHPLLRLRMEDQIHSKPICSAAKSTSRGFRYCWTCKCFATRKAVRGQKDFVGSCPIGLQEITHPVVENGKVLCVISIGNLLVDPIRTEETLRKICARTGVLPEEILRYLPETEPFAPEYPYDFLLHGLDSYIRLITTTQPHRESAPSRHWAVEKVQIYAQSYYHTAITLKQLARLNYINSKYLGRIFKQQTGVSFHEYLNRIRMERAKLLLEQTDRKIIDIAGQVGFETVTYFNRVFQKQFAMAPGEYRAMTKRKSSPEGEKPLDFCPKSATIE